jgi:phosphohistidine swiveling domain-containing protein
MLNPDTRLRIKADDVAAKVIDGEAIIINLATGLYYSLAGTGSEVWALIEDERSLTEMAALLGARYSVPHAGVLADLERLAGELLDEKVVAIASDERPPAAAPAAASLAGKAYAPPTLQTYRDMAELLALDPPMPGLHVAPEAAARRPDP